MNNSINTQSREQKQALCNELKKQFKYVAQELRLFTSPKNPKNDKLYSSIFNVLYESAFKRNEHFIQYEHVGAIDFYVESEKLIIEYDEGQHFSPQRQMTLENYPKDIQLGFDKNEWIAYCKMIKDTYGKKYKIFNRRPCRVEQRAYYDSVKDIEAAKHGYKLIRIKHDDDFDWVNSSQDEIDKEFKRLGIIGVGE